MHRPSRKPPTPQSNARATVRVVAVSLALRLATWLRRHGTMPVQPRPVPVRVRVRRW